MSNLPKATSILVMTPGKYVLAASRRDSTTEFGLIGGKQDEGETIEECAMREFFEETGVRLKHVPQKIYQDICEGGSDGKAFDVSVFEVIAEEDLLAIDAHLSGKRYIQNEPGIRVGYVPVHLVMEGPFGKFNKRLFEATGKAIV